MTISGSALSELYLRAKDLAKCLYNFPYTAPSSVPLSVRNDSELMSIITTTHKTTIGPGGKTQQTTIDAAERIRLQAEFKKRIYALLEKCLIEDPEHGPAFLLYPKVAEFNTRAKDRSALITLFERFLPFVDKVQKDTRAYRLIAQDIQGMSGNYFEKVERHLADFHYGLAVLYKNSKLPVLANEELDKASKLVPQIYGREADKI